MRNARKTLFIIAVLLCILPLGCLPRGTPAAVSDPSLEKTTGDPADNNCGETSCGVLQEGYGQQFEFSVPLSLQKNYPFDEFLRLGAFEAKVVRIDDLPGPPTFATALSGPDRRILLRTQTGETVVIDRVPTSMGGNFCGTINALLPIEAGRTYLFPDVLRPRPDCTQIFVK